MEKYRPGELLLSDAVYEAWQNGKLPPIITATDPYTGETILITTQEGNERMEDKRQPVRELAVGETR